MRFENIISNARIIISSPILVIIWDPQDKSLRHPTHAVRTPQVATELGAISIQMELYQVPGIPRHQA